MENENKISQKRINEAKKILACFEAGAKFYWLEKLVKAGALSQAEAGYLIFKAEA